MAELLKFVLLGGSAAEVEVLCNDLASHFGGGSVQATVIASCPLFVFSGESSQEGKPDQAFKLVGASLQSDFRGLYKELLSDADGVIVLIPAELARIAESRQALLPLHQGIQARREEGGELLFLLQYQWPTKESLPPAESLDEALGINTEVVTRVFTHVGEPDQVNGLQSLLAKSSSNQ